MKKNRKLNENEVLNKIGVESFDKLPKEKFDNIIEILDKVEPEVVKSFLEKVPNFVDCAKFTLSSYKEMLSNALNSNDKAVQNYYETTKIIINSLENELKNEKHTFEEKKYIIEKMFEIEERLNKKDSENKKFILGIVGGVVGAIGTMVAIIFSKGKKG